MAAQRAFFKLYKDIVSTPGLKPVDWILYSILADYCKATGFCWAGIRKLTEDLHSKSHHTTDRSIKRLSAAGVIEIDRRGNGKSNRYTLLESAPKSDTVSAPKSATVQDETIKPKAPPKAPRSAPKSDTVAPPKAPHNKKRIIIKKNIHSQNSDEFRLARLLLEKILKNKANFTKPKLQVWAKTFGEMIGRDNRPPESIEAVIRWAQAHEFWWSRTLNAKKIREHMNQIEIQMDAQNRGQKHEQNNTTNPRDFKYIPTDGVTEISNTG